MGTLAEAILERDEERGARIAGLCKRQVTKSQPESARLFSPGGKERLAFERLLRCSSLTDCRYARSSRLAFISNPSLHCIHYLVKAQ